MKTIREWFQELPPDVRIKALANASSSALNVNCPTMAAALGGAFVWCESPEGQTYWENVTREYTKP